MKVITVIIFACCALAILYGAANTNLQQDAVTAAGTMQNCTIILDAGHGGEDGGAVAPDGTLEKDLNLQIMLNTADFFSLFGINYIPVRTTDTSVCSQGLETVRERKVSDIRNREKLVNETEGAIFLSIHQNMFGVSKYYGTQVFYSSNTSESEQLAETIKNSVISKLQPENTRQCKASGDSIYLLYNAKKTAVLIECGFLSNEKELAKLKDSVYRMQLSYCITTGLIDYLINKEDV